MKAKTREENKSPAGVRATRKVEPRGQEDAAPSSARRTPTKQHSSFAKTAKGTTLTPGPGDHGLLRSRVKFEIYGEEMIDKKVRPSGASGRVYLPPDWVDRHVKVVKID
jgi:hypothetical protein